MSSKLSSTFSLIRFRVSRLMSRVLIHLNLSFAQGYSCRSIWIVLYAATQCGQHSLLKTQYFFQYVLFVSFSKSDFHNCVNLCLALQFNSIDQQVFYANTKLFFFFNHDTSIVHLESGDDDTLRSPSVIQDFLNILGFCFFVKLKNCLFKFCDALGQNC